MVLNKLTSLYLLFLLLVGCTVTPQQDNGISCVSYPVLGSSYSLESSSVTTILSQAIPIVYDTTWTEDEEQQLVKNLQTLTTHRFSKVYVKRAYPSPDGENTILYYALGYIDESVPEDEEGHDISYYAYFLNTTEVPLDFQYDNWANRGEDALWLDHETVFLAANNSAFLYNIKNGVSEKLPISEAPNGAFLTNVLFDQKHLKLFVNYVSWMYGVHTVYSYDLTAKTAQQLYKYPFGELDWEYIPVIRWEKENIFSFTPCQPERVYYHFEYWDGYITGYFEKN